MKAIDLLKLFREPFNLFVANGIQLTDVKLIDMYDDYVRMHKDGEKSHSFRFFKSIRFVLRIIVQTYNVQPLKRIHIAYSSVSIQNL